MANDPNQIVSDLEAAAEGLATATETITKASLWSAIIGFFTALPGLVILAQQFMTFVNNISGNNPKEFISKLGLIMTDLNSAKTPEEKTNAAKNLSSFVSKLK